MSEEQMVDLVQGALAARGITDEVIGAVQDGCYTLWLQTRHCSVPARLSRCPGLLAKGADKPVFAQICAR